VEVKIADDGEILAKGKNVFLGYLHDEEATKATLIDGWLYSGDLGAFDDEGFLTITGRKKDIIITAGGKNIAPKNLESDMKDLPLVAEAVCIGDRRPFLSALICLDDEAAAALCSSKGIDPADATTSDEVRAAIQVGIDAMNAKYANVEHIRKFTILPRMLTMEDEELTPTLKVKRANVSRNWADTIEAIYAK
jgi:long-chain acyl-CoA synthetase